MDQITETPKTGDEAASQAKADERRRDNREAIRFLLDLALIACAVISAYNAGQSLGYRKGLMDHRSL